MLKEIVNVLEKNNGIMLRENLMQEFILKLTWNELKNYLETLIIARYARIFVDPEGRINYAILAPGLLQ